MAQVKWRSRALADLEHLYTFLHEKDSTAARKAAYVLMQGALLLETSPRIGRPMPDETGRRELFIEFGAGAYVLRYIQEANETVVVIRVWHSRENRQQ